MLEIACISIFSINSSPIMVAKFSHVVTNDTGSVDLETVMIILQVKLMSY